MSTRPYRARDRVPAAGVAGAGVSQRACKLLAGELDKRTSIGTIRVVCVVASTEIRRMSLRITLDLSEEDLGYYRRVMDSVWKRNKGRAEKELLDGARRLLKQATKAKAPEYVQTRLADLEVLCSMFDDPEWPLEEDDRARIAAAVGYFAVPKDMIPDKIPGIGFLDDALMAELVIRELTPELDGYRDFCDFRKNERTLRGRTVNREDWLRAKRRQIWLRIKRRQRERRRHASTDGPTHPILRYRS
jgi:uncharacterized membrane protein YkvA (DUF1232 family)